MYKTLLAAVMVLVALLVVVTCAMAASPPSNSGSAITTATMSPVAAATMTPTAATGDVGIIGSFALQAATSALEGAVLVTPSAVQCCTQEVGIAQAKGLQGILTVSTPCDLKAAGTFCATAAPTKTSMGIGTGTTSMIAERQIVRTGTTRTYLSWASLSRTACPSRGTIPASMAVVANLDSGAVTRAS